MYRGWAVSGAELTGLVCFKCEKRPATIWWSEGAMAYVHGAKAPICEACALAMQLAHARERAAAIPEMEARLEELARGGL